MDLLIREAQLDDAEAIVSILNPIIEAGVYTALSTGFQNTEPFATYTRAFDHVGVIGTYVECYRRQGIGRSLFTATFEAARLKGYEKLSAFVRADNMASLAAYLSQGFVKTVPLSLAIFLGTALPILPMSLTPTIRHD